MKARVLPHSREAENALIGSLLLDTKAADWMSGLAAEHFHDPFCAAAMRAITQLSARGEPVDLIGVHRLMVEAGATDSQGINELQETTEWFLSEQEIRAHARRVLDMHRLRQLAHAGAEITELGLTPGAAADKAVDAAQSILARLATAKAKTEPRHITESLADYLQHLEDLSEGKNPAIPTGIGGLDRLLAGGVRRGEVMVLGARPKHGKTALSLTIARNVARHHRVLFLSQEMAVFELMHRHTAAAGSFDLSAIRRADPRDSDMWQAVTEAAEKLGQLHLIHDDQCALTLLDIRRKVMKVRRTHGLDVLVVDFLQLMNGAGEENRNRELDVIVNGIKALALELGIAVLVLSQMSREADKSFSRPTMTHLRDSGAIEAAADQIALLFTDHAHPLSKKDAAFAEFSELELVAHRNGPTGTVPLQFIGKYQQLGDWIGPLPVRTKGGQRDDL